MNTFRNLVKRSLIGGEIRDEVEVSEGVGVLEKVKASLLPILNPLAKP